MKELNRLIETIRALATSAGPWLSPWWGLYSPLIGLVVALALLQMGLIPTIPDKPDCITMQWWKIGSLVVLPLLAFSAWAISTQCYLRTGSGAKIGLAYDGPAVSLSEWKRTKLILKDLFANKLIGNRTSLRFVPLRATQAQSIGNRYRKRYGFVVLLVVETPVTEDGKKGGDHLLISVSTKKEAEPYVKASLQNAMAIWITRAKMTPPTLQDYRRIRAQNLQDLLLLFVATHHFSVGNYLDASTLLRLIDNNLQHLPPDQPPRFNVRDFDVQCCMMPLRFPQSNVPPPDELERRILAAERGMCYFKEFGAVYTALAWAKFLLGDTDGAVKLTIDFKQELARLKESGSPVSGVALANVHLNSGFLDFINLRWKSSHDAYIAMFDCDEHKKLGWDRIVGFIDYVRELDRFEGIPFLQVLYRLIAKQIVPTALREEAESWLKEDGSRNCLSSLLRVVNKPKKTPAVPGEPKKQHRKKGK